MKYTAIIHGERIDIELNVVGGSVEARVGGRKYLLEARMVEPGIYWFNWNNRSLRFRSRGTVRNTSFRFRTAGFMSRWSMRERGSVEPPRAAVMAWPKSGRPCRAKL